jgi:hypothetical protein
VQHLFFLCPIAKVVWGCIAIQIGADCIPSSALQYYKWADKFLVLNTCKPCVFQQMAIWKVRNNKVCFEKKLIKESYEIYFMLVLF